MKNLVLAGLLMVGFSALAESTIHLPIKGENGTTVQAINKALKSKGLSAQLEEYFELSTKDKKPYEKYEKMTKKFADLSKAAGMEDGMASEAIPNSDLKGTCYTGPAGQAVVDLIFDLAGSAYTEQMNLWGWKYKSQIGYGKNMGEKQEIEDYLKTSKLWTGWRGQGEAMLIVVAYSDDGDDVNEVILPRCK